ncbi:uncharacterized protein LOC116351318 [Contarinia nasturtii]|uniref:uncharacterized protein LOC116351318 n=1 Tax=Contarinia nasturtii TaxID=265458 RepID=UPI0012D40804|nr:uncharacterized protein LOC116351318 [Contarinia nasturtii]
MLNRKIVISIYFSILALSILEASPTSSSNLKRGRDRNLLTFDVEDGRNKIIKFDIRYIEQSQFEDVVHILAQHSNEEALSASYLASSGLEAMKRVWRNQLSEKLSVACFKRGSKEIIGILMLNKNQKKPNDHTRKYELIPRFSIFEHHLINEYLSGDSMYVSPQYSRYGIKKQLLLATEPVCQDNGLEVAASYFTSPSLNEIAEEAGFEIIRDCGPVNRGDPNNIIYFRSKRYYY